MVPLYINNVQINIPNAKIYHGANLIYSSITSLVNPNNLWKSPQQVDYYLTNNPELKTIADQPQAKWINGSTSQSTVSGWASEASGKTMLLVLYAIPGRDNGQYSAGGFANSTEYLNFCTTIKNGIGTAPAIVVLEPDALGLSEGISDSTLRAQRIQTLKDAVGIFAGISNVELYIEASKWISISRNAELLQAVDVSKVKGFCLNVSGYDSQSYCYQYGNDLVSALNSKGITNKLFIVDSSRNGNGPLTSAYGSVGQPWFDANVPWCNPPGRALGLVPGTVSGQPNCRATFWIKSPGESDGTFPTNTQSNYYGESAPSAGQFWVPNARDLLGLLPKSSTPSTPLKFASLKENFNSSLGAFQASSSPGVTVTGGRARIPADTTYVTMSSSNSYSLKDSSIAAEIYPPSFTGDATESWVQFAVGSSNTSEGTRLNIQVSQTLVRFGSETGYYDSLAVEKEYSLNYRRIRIRESGGTLYFETSASGETWDVQRTITTPSYITDTANLRVSFTAYKNASTGYAEVDNINY